MIDNANENEPNQIKNVVESFKNSIKYTWENEGNALLADSKIVLNTEEKQILAALLILEAPSDFNRKRIWLIGSGAKREMLNNPGYYNSILNIFPSNIEIPSMKTIDLDIHRTFGQDPFFQNERNQTKLRNILVAVSRRIHSIGYCQGFNFMVGRILKLFKTEEETFWIFIQIVEKYLQINYYTDLTGLMIDCVIISRILTIIFPEMIDGLAKTNYDVSLNNFLFKSLLCLFAENLNEYMLLNIWDVFFLKGDTTLFKGITCLIKAHEHKIVSANSLSIISKIFSEDIYNYRDKEMMIYYLLLKRYDFSKESIENNRQIFFPTLQARLIKISSSLSTSTKNESKTQENCDINSPICVNDSIKHYRDVYIIRQAESQIIIKKNYFFKHCQSFPFESPMIVNKYASLLIERSVHSCHLNKEKDESTLFPKLDPVEGSEYIHSLIKELNT